MHSVLMQVPRRQVLQLGAAGIASLVFTRAGLAQPRPAIPRFAAHTLFVITRSKNKNVVYYDLRLTPRGTIASQTDPIDAYWIMYADAGQREELTWSERRLAYGYELRSAVAPSGFRARLTAVPQRPIEVWRKDDGVFVASCTIGQQVAVLRQVHVVAGVSWTGLDVQHIDLVGVDPKTGKPIVERISGKQSTSDSHLPSTQNHSSLRRDQNPCL